MLFGHLPRVAIHHQRIMSWLAWRHSSSYRWECRLYLLGLCPAGNSGKAVVVIYFCRFQTGTVDAGAEIIDRIDRAITVTEIAVTRLCVIRRPGVTPVRGNVVVVHLLGSHDEDLLLRCGAGEQASIGQGIKAFGLGIISGRRLHGKLLRVLPEADGMRFVIIIDGRFVVRTGVVFLGTTGEQNRYTAK